ncbi:MAG: ribonuclease, Rne/Rng family, insertion, partial [Acidobacteriaceae bacterium]|nr:ribonuclease, Rne/Rng family, insertion [Acidobacteriaceae bacterium]
MAKEICISSTPHETRLAIVEDDQLTEIYYERENEYTLAGSIYKGKVTRVLPGMQSAFVDLGLERDAFLYVTDFLEEQEDSEEYEGVKQGGGGRKERVEGERPEGGRAEGGRSEGRQGRRGRGQDRSQDRNQDRGQERPAAAAPLSIEPEGSALAEAEGEPSAEGQGQDEFEQGTRRWRGRRGRRRAGVRGPREGGAEESVRKSAEGNASDRGPASSVASGSLSIEAEAAPESFEPEARRRAEQPVREQSRSEGRRGRGPVITLPGEALQKYGQQPAAGEDPTKTPREERPVQSAQVTVRPSTLVEHPIEWDGVSVAMPGESLSRHKEFAERGSQAASEAASSRRVFAEPTSGDISQSGVAERSSPEPVFAEPIGELQAVSSEHAPIDTEFPPAHSEKHAASFGSETHAVEAPAPLGREETEETQEFDPENASASHRVDLSSPSEFRLSSLFGRDPEPAEKQESPSGEAQVSETTQGFEQPEPAHHAVETAPQSAHERDVSPRGGILNGAEGQLEVEQHDHEIHHETHAEPTHESAALDHLRAFTPGDGQVEEEVIDEEEYDFAPLPEHASHEDDHDLSDLVEEETQMAGGSEIGEVIRDAHIDREVTSSDDDDFEDSDEEDEVAEGEQPAVAVAGEEEAPSPRRGGRDDRQRGGRERRGRGRNGRRQSAQTSDLPIISELLKQGQEILVQIAKEPIAKKGARITSHIALPGRFLVFMPTVNHIGVSRKIWSDEERQRLKRILISEKGEA